MPMLLTLIREEFQMADSLVVITPLDGRDYFPLIQREFDQLSTIATMFDGFNIGRTIMDLANSKCARLSRWVWCTYLQRINESSVPNCNSTDHRIGKAFRARHIIEELPLLLLVVLLLVVTIVMIVQTIKRGNN